ncbi:MAG: CAP domain-containing protein [Deltaproteobacteria bacterium]|nr:CAP domain-containing protein [Deltaproteobacteria bacterium]
MKRQAAALGWLLVVLMGCSSQHRGSDSKSPDRGSTHRTARKPKGPPKPVERPAGLLSLADAERYMLALINHDREAEGEAALEWDPIAAKAGREHAEDMAKHGYTGHIGTDGSNPELRYTEAGGMDMAQENAGCFADAKARELDPNPKFDPRAIEKVEAAFMAEKPPADGHRKNILKPWHTHVGVGLTQAKDLSIVCMAQEFVDRYGTYDAIPKQAKIGQKVKVSGKVESPAKIVGVGIARTELPTARQPSELLRTGSYPIPAPFQTYFPKGFVTPIPVEVKGGEFTIEFPLSDNKASPGAGRAGLYEVSVWAEVPGNKDFVMVSLRTVRVK